MKLPGHGVSAGEDDLVFLVRLLHAGDLQVLEDHLCEIGRCSSSSASCARPSCQATSISSSFSSTARMRCGDRLSTVNGPATRTSSYPRRACHRGTRTRPWQRLRRRSPSGARYAASHHSACSVLGCVGPFSLGLARNFPLFPVLA